MTGEGLLPTRDQLRCCLQAIYGDLSQHGWRLRMRHRFGYFAPGVWYEKVVDSLVTDSCQWIDVGGGTNVLPMNRLLAERLASRCGYLAGVDPSETIEENRLVHKRVQCIVEEYHTERKFDLATLRMVAEHIVNPDAATASLARLLRPGGKAHPTAVHR